VSIPSASPTNGDDRLLTAPEFADLLLELHGQRRLLVDQVHLTTDAFLRLDEGLPPGHLRYCQARAHASMRGRRLEAKTIAIREAILNLQDDFERMTVRQIFYQLASVLQIVPKTDPGYDQVQGQVLKLRREEFLPWVFIADGTRFVTAPETFDGIDDALQEAARTYRRNLWRSQGVRIEFWLEKDALASLISPTTYEWGVRLMVSRGQSSDTYCYSAAQDAKEAWEKAEIETFVFALYDSDKSGRSAAAKIEEKLRRYSDNAPITFELLAVTDEQIEHWNLPTRPAKEKGEPDAVELDAIPPDKLIAIVSAAITSLVDEDAWEKEQKVENSEREILERMAGTA
jgi:hypothetical protein